jgi:hypothetical protein
MSTPFEIFRTPITVYRNVNGFFVEGRWQEGSQATLSADLVTGNVIDISINSVALASIPFTTSQENTMALIAAAIEAQPEVNRVNLSGTNDRVLTIIANVGENVTIDSFVVTGGASQPTVTLEEAPEVITITASIQPMSGEEMEMLPEGRHDQAGYKLYTSFRIRTVTDINPDQVEIFGERYEVVQVFPWQNNSNFNIVNHYKFLTLKLEELGAI